MPKVAFIGMESSREIENAPDRFVKFKLIKLRISKVTVLVFRHKKNAPNAFIYLRIYILEHKTTSFKV